MSRGTLAGLLLVSLAANVVLAVQLLTPPSTPDERPIRRPEPPQRVKPARRRALPAMHLSKERGEAPPDAGSVDTPPPPPAVDRKRLALPMNELATQMAMDAYSDNLKTLFGGPPPEPSPERAAKTRRLHLKEAIAAMDLSSVEAEQYETWIVEHGAAVDEAHRSGDRQRHFDVLLEHFVDEERFLEDLVGPSRATRYLDARLEHRVFVIVGVAAVADVAPREALARYQSARRD